MKSLSIRGSSRRRVRVMILSLIVVSVVCKAQQLKENRRPSIHRPLPHSNFFGNSPPTPKVMVPLGGHNDGSFGNKGTHLSPVLSRSSQSTHPLSVTDETHSTTGLLPLDPRPDFDNPSFLPQIDVIVKPAEDVALDDGELVPLRPAPPPPGLVEEAFNKFKIAPPDAPLTSFSENDARPRPSKFSFKEPTVIALASRQSSLISPSLPHQNHVTHPQFQFHSRLPLQRTEVVERTRPHPQPSIRNSMRPQEVPLDNNVIHRASSSFHRQENLLNQEFNGAGGDYIDEEEDEDKPDRLALLLQETSFTCSQKKDGYYADEQLQCEVFHFCQDKVKHSWLCPNGASFHQVHLICMPRTEDNICEKSSKFYFVNDFLYKEVDEIGSNKTYADRYYPEGFEEGIAKLEERSSTSLNPIKSKPHIQDPQAHIRNTEFQNIRQHPEFHNFEERSNTPDFHYYQESNLQIHQGTTLGSTQQVFPTSVQKHSISDGFLQRASEKKRYPSAIHQRNVSASRFHK